ncbi:MAG TPA: hypothetical protein VKU94_04570 [Geobacterales bacterium]|nr:hypothetical protein [Geobacterales bacterium]
MSFLNQDNGIWTSARNNGSGGPITDINIQTHALPDATPIPVKQVQSNIVIPIDIQAHLQSTIQTHNAVSIPASGGSSPSAWIDTDGFDKVAFVMKNDATVTSNCDIRWSADGSNIHGVDFAVLGGANQYKTYIVDTKARYVQFSLINSDTASAHTFTAYAYLKA